MTDLVRLPLGKEREVRIQEKLRRELGAEICALLNEPAVIEILLNADGRIWVERLGHEMEPFGTMSAHQAEAMMATVASTLKTTLTRESPILECELPIDGSRFEALMPPIVSAPVFAIRRRAISIYSLAHYVSAQILTAAQRASLCAAIDAHQNILVVGGTGSGKTTLTNALIDYMASAWSHERLVIIEDTAEIQCRAENSLILRATEQVDMLRLLKATMRLRPTRILVGEVRGAEALSLIKAWNTGHPGGIATVHANTAESALTRLESLIAEATPAPSHGLIAAAVNLIVSIVKTATGRKVQEVLRVDGFCNGRYQLTPLH